jgi:nitroimidazol reductase NimA-like FMN-containing flavoprotein (pyridoxamine 5'-phosphate oxidase superfamily)
LAFVDDRGPIVLPVNYIVDRHTVVFRTDEGTKLDIAARRERVAFEVDSADQAVGGGWSVLVRGEAVEVTDPDELADVRRLPLHPAAPGRKDRYVRVLPSAVSGRRFTAPPGTPSDWWG